MLKVKWAFKLIRDIILFGYVNQSYFISLLILGFLLISAVIFSAQISAPFIYTLF